MKKLMMPFIVLLSMIYLFVPCPAAASQTPNAKSAILIDVVSGRVLYSKNEKERLPMASTTKIMTAITAIENGRLDDVVTASFRAQNTGGSSIYLQAGERLSLEDLLYGLMLESGNDAAVAIAEHIGGSIEGFSRMMNEKAAEIGAFNSSFANPHGLDNREHYTTAEDLGKIASYALRNETFSTIVSTKQKKIPWWGRSYNRILTNKNKLLWNLEGGDGVKTGYTGNAGRCLVSSATRDGWQLAGVVLNCGPMWEESINMLEYGFSTYKPVTYYEQGQFVKTVAVANGKKDRVRLVTDRLVRIPLTEEEEEKVIVVEEWEDILRAPVKEGQTAGSVRVELEGKVLFRANLICQESIKEKSLRKLFFEILSNAI
ncbi:MAG: D-alanyl-D-alanine carboxypeptidase [Firmicutes bacterium]|nr:D-alanyl-D-alanine carboxypeptidase [Bacillota bacterium]MDI6707151.1 D-alanyl-D-alanine carboxypeptidase family protein [Bacillota bacterium]